MEMHTEVIIAIIVAGFALIGSLVTYIGSARKNEVEALSRIITELRTHIDDLEQDKEDLQAWAEKLVCQIKDAGLEPVRFSRSERKTQPVKKE